MGTNDNLITQSTIREVSALQKVEIGHYITAQYVITAVSVLPLMRSCQQLITLQKKN